MSLEGYSTAAGAKNTSASVKMPVRWELKAGGLVGPYLQAGRVNDNNSPLQDEVLPRGALRIADLGYFSLNELSTLDHDGVYWLTKVKSQCVIYAKAKRWEGATFLSKHCCASMDLRVLLGAKEKVNCRLMAQKVAPEVANQRKRRNGRARRHLKDH